MLLDRESWIVLGGVGSFLTIATIIALVLRLTTKQSKNRATIENLFDRTLAWWIMVAVLIGALAIGRYGVLVLFALLSFRALREVVTLSHTRRGDHRTLFWAFFVAVPLQYLVLGLEWYGTFTVLLPVWGFLILTIRTAAAGDTTRFFERISRLFWSLMICVFFLSHVPALLFVLPSHVAEHGAHLMIFLLIVVQMSDVMQYVFGKLLGRHKIAPSLSPSKTWEGLIGGILSACAIGTGLWWMTPLLWWQASWMSLLICMMGFFGGLVMSAIKRDAGVKDWGNLIPGHGGVMDRIDGLAFAAPAFFHVLMYLYSNVDGKL